MWSSPLLRKRLQALPREQRGSTIVLAGLAFVVLAAFAGLAIDGGTLYAMKTQLKKVANAAALSGAQELTNSESNVTEVVDTVLADHGETGNRDLLTIRMGTDVTVGLTKRVPLAFARLFGMDDAVVSVASTAKLEPMGEATGVVPLGIDERVALTYNTPYSLKVDETGEDTGFFGVLALGGPGAQTYEDNLMYGYRNGIAIGDVIDTQTGNVAGKTQNGVDYRITQCPNADVDTTVRACARIVLIPVYRPYLVQSNQMKQIQVTGFAYFYITDPMDMHDKSIRGMFIRRAGTGIGGGSEAPDDGAYAIKLTQ